MKRIVALLLLISFCLVSCDPSSELPKETLMRIAFLDVGQGDATLIRTPSGDILIDAGPESSQAELCRKLKKAGVTALELAVFTHPDEDHIGGADGVIEQFEVQKIWLPAGDSEEESYMRLLDAAKKKDVCIDRVGIGDDLRLGEIDLTVLSTLLGASNDSNDNSIVIRLLCGSASVLLSGDAGTDVEERLLEAYRPYLDVDIYKVAHHGSSSSSSEAFLAAMTPEWAIIECGAGNSYGHPHGAVLERLEDCGATVLRTDREGDIVFDCDGHTFTRVED